MSFSKLKSMQLYACQPYFVDVEIDISNGLHSFSIVGLPDKATEEAKDRISAAIKNSGFDSPKSKNQRLIISLAPAELRKEGSNFDLAMALAYLLSTKSIVFDPVYKVFIGELSLDGILRPVKGVLPLIIEAKNKGIKEIYIPIQNSEEAALIKDITIFPTSTLREIVDHLDEKAKGDQKIIPLSPVNSNKIPPVPTIDFAKIKGQEGARRALEIAASGGHNIMMYGPPGTGKTMLAHAFIGILPALSFDEMIEVTSIHSSQKIFAGVIASPPFRCPHHSASYTSMIGGGNVPRPGEITLAHKGVLFMDEFPEFDMRVINALRQPLEEKKIEIARTKTAVSFPSDFILVASMNMCPCGFRGSRKKECICSVSAIQRYQRKISGPIVDRIDMWIEVSEVEYKKLGDDRPGESTKVIVERVVSARALKQKRAAKESLSPKLLSFLNDSAKALSLSARAYYKVIRVAQTIACLEGKEEIEESHLLESLQYRPKLFS